jgi:site-specific DNA recombinase
MNIVTCCRISSDAQRDGQSLDAQERLLTEHAQRQGWNVVRKFSFIETASKVSERRQFNAMLEWVEANKVKLGLKGLLFHKLDRSLRNLYDAWALPEWSREHGVDLLFSADNVNLSTPSGRMMFGIQAVVASHYSDNLRQEVLKGMEQRCLNGWWPHMPPVGYVNAKDPKAEIQIKVDPESEPMARRMFEAYDAGLTVYEIRDEIRALGHPFSVHQVLTCLRSRFYIGEFVWHHRVFPGKHEPIIDRQLWRRVQERLNGKRPNGRGHGPSLNELPLAGGLIRSKIDGSALTGERPTKKRKDGSKAIHYYYRTNRPKEGQAIRWRAADLEEAVARELDKLTLPEDIRNLFREKLKMELAAEGQYRKAAANLLQKRIGELRSRMDKLMNAFLDGTVDKDAYSAKRSELQAELDAVRAEVSAEDSATDKTYDDIILAFDMSQGLGATFRGSNSARKRRILEAVCSNLQADATTVYVEWSYPFGSHILGRKEKNGGRTGTRTPDLMGVIHAL